MTTRYEANPTMTALRYLIATLLAAGLALAQTVQYNPFTRKLDLVGTSTPPSAGASGAITVVSNVVDVDTSVVPLKTTSQTIPSAWDFSGFLGIPNAAGAPTSTECDSAGESGRIKMRTDGSTGQKLYLCKGAAGWELVGSSSSWELVKTTGCASVGVSTANGAAPDWWTQGGVNAVVLEAFTSGTAATVAFAPCYWSFVTHATDDKVMAFVWRLPPQFSGTSATLVLDFALNDGTAGQTFSMKVDSQCLTLGQNMYGTLASNYANQLTRTWTAQATNMAWQRDTLSLTLTGCSAQDILLTRVQLDNGVGTATPGTTTANILRAILQQ